MLGRKRHWNTHAASFFAASAITLTSSCTSKLYEQSVAAYSSGFEGAKAYVQDRSNGLKHAQRVYSLEKQFPNSYSVINNKSSEPTTSFSNYVCKSDERLAGNVAALSVLGAANKEISIINKKPEKNIGAITKGIIDDLTAPSSLAATPVSAEDWEEEEDACRMRVYTLATTDMKQIFEQPSERFLPQAVAALAVLEAAYKVLLETGAGMESELRARKLRVYLTEQETRKHVCEP